MTAFIKKRFIFAILFILISAATIGLLEFYNHKAKANSANSLPTQGPIISFNFDDGFLSAYTIAKPIMDQAGFKSTYYIITGVLNNKGYMSKRQVLDLQADGNEIGAHTRHHIKLGLITDKSVIRDEVLGSKQDLLKMGIKDVSTFAYPNGSFSDLTEQVMKESGFKGARITRPLLNDSATDRFLLLRQRVEAGTSFAEVKDSIDKSIAEKKWLILVFHRIDETGAENASHELLQQIVDYVKEKNVPVVTNEQGLQMLDRIK